MVFRKLSVLVPTRRRVERLRKLWKSYHDTTFGVEQLSEVVFRVDDDDLETLNFVLNEWFPQDSYKLFIGPRHSGYRSLPQFFNEAATIASGDVVMCGNDDMMFKTAGWAHELLAAANRYPDGVFDFGVRTHNEDHYPFATVSKAVVDRLGFLFDPQIFWGDLYLRDVMAYFGRCIMLPEVEIAHDWAGNDPDTTFLEGERVRRSNWMGAVHEQAVTNAIRTLKGQFDASACVHPSTEAV